MVNELAVRVVRAVRAWKRRVCRPNMGLIFLAAAEAVKKHKKFFGDDDDDEKADDKGLGAAAAMQALKLFSSGDTGGQKQSQGGFAGLAMAEASRVSLVIHLSPFLPSPPLVTVCGGNGGTLYVFVKQASG